VQSADGGVPAFDDAIEKAKFVDNRCPAQRQYFDEFSSETIFLEQKQVIWAKNVQRL